MDQFFQGSEKRQRKRFRLSHKAEIQVQGQFFEATLIDFSTRGFCLATAANIPNDDKVQVVFSLQSPRDWVFLIAIVNQKLMNQKGSQVSRLGVRITSFSSNPAAFFEHLVHLVKVAQAAPVAAKPVEKTVVGQVTGATQSTESKKKAGTKTKKEHRTDKRIPYSADAKIRIGEKIFKASVHDVSQRGLSVQAPMEMPVSKQMNVLIFMPDGARLQVDAVERERQIVEQSDGIGLRLGLRIVRSDEQFKKFFIHLRDDEERDVTLRQTGAQDDTGKTHILSSERHLGDASFGLLGKQKYKFMKPLGKGGFAEVYLVRDLALNRDVAMKVLTPKFSSDPKLSSRFIAEAQIAAQFEHAHIATVYEVGDIPNHEYKEKLDFPPEILAAYGARIVYFTMQYIQGHSIAEFIKNEGRLDGKRTLLWSSAVAKALAYAHEKGVVHRDIKPENIMVTLEKHVLVTDFGIAKVLSRQVDDDPEVEGSVEQDKTRGFMGTPIYASPEQVVAEGIDGRSDLYSLGVMMYEMLLGQPPFRGERWVETIAMHLHKLPVPLIDQDAQISLNLSDLVMKCLEKDKENRYQSASVFVEAIEKVYLFLQRGDIEVEAQTAFDEDSFELVKRLFVQFGKAYRTIGTYPETHDLVKQATTELYKRFEAFFAKHERLDIRIESMRMMFLHQTIWEEDQKENAFCFNLFRDGIRKLLFFRGMPAEEIESLMIRLFRYVNDHSNYEEDSVTLLFQAGLQFIDFEYVDSFYEDETSLAKIQQVQTYWLNRSPWKFADLAQRLHPISDVLELEKQIDHSYKTLPVAKLKHYLTKEVDQAIRLKAIDIFLSHLRLETDVEDFERHFAVLEDVVYSCLTENDLTAVRQIFSALEIWSHEIPESDPRQMHKRLLLLKERMSQQDFLDELIDKYFTVDRSTKDAIFNLCEFMLPNIAVKVIFNRFNTEVEEWRKIFLSEMAVIASGATLTPLIKMSLKLSDEHAAIMLNGFARSSDKLSKSVFDSWLKHSGSQTRLRVARMIAAAKDPALLDLMIRIGRDPNLKFEESRRYAWRYIGQVAKPKLAPIVLEFMNLDVFLPLSEDERKTIIQYAGKSGVDKNFDFLVGLLNEHGAFGQGKADLEDRKLAATILLKTGQKIGREAVGKMAKKLIGNRDLINHCKQLLEANS